MPIKMIELLQNRWAGRAILPDPLSDEMIEDLVEAVRLTPSCFNNQPARFLFLLSDQALKKGVETLSEGNRVWAFRAPLLVVGYTKAEDDCIIKDGREYHQFDLGLAVMNLMSAATEHGLAARPMAGFSPQKVKELFEMEEDCKPFVMIAVGRPSDQDDYLPERLIGKHKEPRDRHPGEHFVKKL